MLRWLSKYRNDPGEVIVVSGLPRSGTSMLMQVLAAGGIEVMSDGLRAPDESNPRGYYEFEPVKRLNRGDNHWLKASQGRAVKVISALLPNLPDTYHYRVIFMERDLEEILTSQQTMIQTAATDQHFNLVAMRSDLARHLVTISRWLDTQPNMQILYIDHRQMIEKPASQLNQIAIFLRRDLNIQAMQAVIDPQLHRAKASASKPNSENH